MSKIIIRNHKNRIFFIVFNIFFALGPKNMPVTEGLQLALILVPNNLSKNMYGKMPGGGGEGGFTRLALSLITHQNGSSPSVLKSSTGIHLNIFLPLIFFILIKGS